MRPLVITPEVRADVADLIERAKTWRFSYPDLKLIKAGAKPPPGDDSRFRCMIPMGYRCVYTHEQQPMQGWCRHLSISVHPVKEGHGPSVDAVNEIAKLFGFKEGINSADHFYLEDTEPCGRVINLLQRVIEGDTT